MPQIQGVDRSALTRPHALLMAGVLMFFYLDAFVLGAPGGMALALLLLALVVLLGFLRHAGHGPPGAIQPVPVLLAAFAALVVLALSRGAHVSVALAAALVGAAGGLVEAIGHSSVVSVLSQLPATMRQP